LKYKQVQEFKETELGLLPKDWEVRKLNDILSDKLRHGIYKSKEYVDPKGVRILKMGLLDVCDRIDHQNMERVIVSDSEINTYRIREGNVIFARTSMMTGGIGNCGIVMKHTDPIIFDGNLLCAEINTEMADPTFIFYYFKSKYGQNEIARITGGTQSRNIAGSQLVNVSVILPSKYEQIKLSQILFNIDMKIENIKSQNKILEQIAQTIFKSWFVDFDGVTEFEDSELGPIPKGWTVDKLINRISVTYGYPFKSNLFNSENGKPVIRIRNLDDNHSGTLTTENCDKKYYVHAGDVLTGMDGEFNTHIWLGLESLLNQRVCKLYSRNNNMGNYFILFLIKQKFKDYEQKISGTTVIHLSKPDIEELKILLPLNLVLEKYDKLVNPLFEKLIKNQSELRVVNPLFEKLLPKLLSGEIRV